VTNKKALKLNELYWKQLPKNKGWGKFPVFSSRWLSKIIIFVKNNKKDFLIYIQINIF